MVYNFSFQDGAQFIYIVQQPQQKGEMLFQEGLFRDEIKRKNSCVKNEIHT